jgi:hypothetical protein
MRGEESSHFAVQVFKLLQQKPFKASNFNVTVNKPNSSSGQIRKNHTNKMI